MTIKEISAASTYAERARTINRQLSRLEELRKLHERTRAKDRRNWALVGDLGRVTDLLDQALLALGAGEDDVNAERAARGLEAL